MTKTKTPTAPRDLSPQAAAIWRKLHGEFELADSGAIEVLAAGLRAFDEMRKAEELLAKDGLVVLDRYSVPKTHPAVDIARSARGQWLMALRMLGLHRQGAAVE